MEAGSGDRVNILCTEESIKGILMPSLDKNFVVVKLDNGYNIGIAKRNIKKIELIEKKTARPQKISISQDIKLPRIAILHTGGTIASKVDYSTGAVTPQFKPEELLQMFPEIKKIANIESRLMANILSENITFAHYNLLAKEIEKEIKNGAKGVIVTHGTDTLHYTAAVLSFVLENLSIPLIVVGAQRSSDRGSSDAAINLISAASFIVNTNFKGVAVCMHENENDDSCLIIHGTSCRKMHTTRRDAFRPINKLPIAKVNYKTKRIDYLSDYKKTADGELKLKPFDEKLKIGIIKTYPNMFSEEFEAYKNFDGLIIEGTGLGHAPIIEYDNFTKENKKIKEAIAYLAKKMPVVITSQTIYGRINLNIYGPGRELKEIGVLGDGHDMTSETAFIKLAWLLSNFPKEKVKELLTKNLRGEISERTEKETFLI
jgi:glutamyl-tRNA(Gln) amidotransferase subunit D